MLWHWRFSLLVWKKCWILLSKLSIWSKQGQWITRCSKCCAKRLGLNTLYFFFTQKYGGFLEENFELRESIEMFLHEKGSNLLQHFTDPDFVVSLAYLAYVFALLNSLSISLQGRGVMILEAEEKVKSFQEKLSLWGRRISSENFANFLLFDIISSDPAYPVGPKLHESVITHVETWSHLWRLYPFNVSFNKISDASQAKDELLDLHNNQKLFFDFESMELSRFWCKFGRHTLSWQSKLQSSSPIHHNLPLWIRIFCTSNNRNQNKEQTKSRTWHMSDSVKDVA